MSGGLLDIVREALGDLGHKEAELLEFMDANGMRYPIVYMDALAEPADVILLADFIGMEPSRLFERTKYTEHLVRAIFKERWPVYKSKVNINYDAAWEKVWEGTDFKGEIGGAAIRRNVNLILDGLCPPSSLSDLSCEPLECAECGAR